MDTAVRDPPCTAAVAISAAAGAMPDHFSISAMGTFQTCPRQWRYKYLDRASPEFVPSSLLFGAAVHTALETIHRAVMNGSVASFDEAAHVFADHWATESAEKAVRFCQGESTETLHALARSLLALYVEHHVPTLGWVRKVEESVRAALPGMSVPVVGRIDWLAEDDQALWLVDAKTARSAFNDDRLREVTPQLALYASTYMPLAAFLGKPLRGRLVLFRKLKKPRIEVRELDLGAADLAYTQQMLRETWSLIEAAYRADSFPVCPSWACKQCVYQLRCRQESTTAY
jgi:putative RecB family exonuclease